MDEFLDPQQKPYLRWLLKRAFSIQNVNQPRGPRLEYALHAAARDGNLDQVKWLLGRGAAVDVRDKDGNSPIYYACRQNHLEVVRFLEARGAARCLHERNSMGSVPFALYLNGRDVNSAAERRAIGRPKLTPTLGPLTPSSFVGGAAFTTILGGGLESAKTSKLNHSKSGAAPKSRGGNIDSGSAGSSGARKEPNRPRSAPPRGAAQQVFDHPLDRKPRQRQAATPRRPSQSSLPALSPTTMRLEGKDKAFVSHLLNQTMRGRNTRGARTPTRQRRPSGTMSAATLDFAAESMRANAAMFPESPGRE